MGFKCSLTKADWQKGYDAGRAGKPNEVPEGVEVLSWYSGYIEGKAEAEQEHTPPPLRSGEKKAN